MLLDPPNVLQLDEENKEKFLLFGALNLWLYMDVEKQSCTWGIGVIGGSDD